MEYMDAAEIRKFWAGLGLAMMLILFVAWTEEP